MTEVAEVPDAGAPLAGAPDGLDAPAVEEPGGPVGLLILIGLLALLGVSAGISFVYVVVALIVMIFMHELGHYMAARRGGMKVTEFFIGFGPRLWSFRRGETEYGFKAIPAGAYVRIIGMNNLEEVDPADEPRTYRQQSYPKRLLVAVAGSAMHFLMALALLYALLVSHGIDVDEVATDRDWTVEQIAEGGSAEAMGLLPGDRILEANGVAFSTWTGVREFIQAHPDESVELVVARDGELLSISGDLGSDAESGTGRIGIIRSGQSFRTEGPLEAVPTTFAEFGSGVKLTITTLGDFFSPSGLANFFGRLGPDDQASDAPADGAGDDGDRILSVVGATRLGAELTEDGIAGLLVFLFSINIFVGVFNLMPLLPLDGGHVVVATYERIRSRAGRPYHADVAELLPLTYAVVLLLLTVGLAAIYLDLSDPLSL